METGPGKGFIGGSDREVMWKQDQVRVKLEGSDRQGNNVERTKHQDLKVLGTG